ncbi:glucosamine-6-phosphate deaminase [Brassicibacter mesophilus]|uniref:glucosamine-6-phosphate deaminase n=1 Tax=Brassicibacter mesophilus TaxID=745119 RepID=UPI003D20CE6C
MKIIVVNNYNEMSKKAANIIASQIILNSNSVLGFATGDTPLGTYKELINIYNEGDIDFSDIKTFNLDEYYHLPKENPQSYNFYMSENLFKRVNVKPENIHIPNGMCNSIEDECASYEETIKQAGGIDLQLLGIGRNGHIGFNEPDLKFEATTHLVHLDEDTIKANSRFFDSIEEVPTKAISMGIKTIMQAKKIVLLASGVEKSEAIYNTVKGSITPEVPASVLQLHPDVTVIIDKDAGSRL